MVECAITHKQKTRLRKDGGDALIAVHEEEKGGEGEEEDPLVAAMAKVDRKMSVKKMSQEGRRADGQAREESSKAQGAHMAKMVAMGSLVHTNTSKSATAYNSQTSVKESSRGNTDGAPTLEANSPAGGKEEEQGPPTFQAGTLNVTAVDLAARSGSEGMSVDMDTEALNSYDSRPDINIGKLQSPMIVKEHPLLEEKEDFSGKLDNAAKLAKKDALKYYIKA